MVAVSVKFPYKSHKGLTGTFFLKQRLLEGRIKDRWRWCPYPMTSHRTKWSFVCSLPSSWDEIGKHHVMNVMENESVHGGSHCNLRTLPSSTPRLLQDKQCYQAVATALLLTFSFWLLFSCLPCAKASHGKENVQWYIRRSVPARNQGDDTLLSTSESLIGC